MSDIEEIVVIGAGIVGVSTAIWLQRFGRTVTLIDREGPAAGASQGNGGILASIAVVPVTVPGMAMQAPRMLFSRDEPLFLRWGYLPRLLPFLRHYLSYGRAERVAVTSKALNTMLHDAPDQHAALAADTDAARYISRGSYLYAYQDRAAFEADRYAWDLRREAGLNFRELDAAGLAEHDPTLDGRFGLGVECLDHGIITDPGAYVRTLAAKFEASGGTILQGEVTDFRSKDGRATAVATGSGDITADAFVLTTGAWSAPLARTLGVSVPLESERGYHIEFHNPNLQLRSPVMVASGKFVVTPMEGRIRCAGVLEFGGLEAGPSRAPFDLLKRQAKRLFPDLTYDHVTEWMGHRPSPADSRPIIGPSPRLSNVFLGYGHHHIGLTGGPKSGRWIAQMMTGAPINEDLSAFSPARRV